MNQLDHADDLCDDTPFLLSDEDAVSLVFYIIKVFLIITMPFCYALV